MADPRETSFYVDPTKRSIVLPGLAADKIYNLAVRGYRRVDNDISASGVIFSELTRAKSWRYQPSTTVAFNGDVTGTIQGVASSQVIADLVGLTSDGVLSRGEKATFALAYTQMAATYDAASSKSLQLGGTDSQRSAAFAAVDALNDYLETLRPAWNDMTVDTPIDPDTFRAAWATVQATVADLQAAVTDRASQLANWTGVTGPGKPQDNATVGAPAGTNVGDVPVTSIVDAVKGLDGSVLKIRDVSSQVADARTAAAAASSEAAAARQDVINAKADLKVSVDAAQRDASSARSEAAQVGSDLAKARSDLSTAVSAAQGDANAARTQADTARTEVSQARGDLASEVQRAKDDAAAIRRDIVDVKQTADGATSSIRDEAVIRSRDDSALGGRIQTIEADYTTAGRADQIAQAKVNDEATVRGREDSALAGRLQTTEAQMRGDQDSVLAGRIRDEATARATAVSSVVDRTSTLEASAANAAGYLNTNPSFAQWPDGSDWPTGWGWWDATGHISHERISSGRPTGGYAIQIAARAGQECGFAQIGAAGPVVTSGWYVFEAEVALNSGSWSGAGLTIQGQELLHFATEADSNGLVSATALGLRRFTKLVHVNGDKRNWHPMTNWGVWPMAAKQLVWYRAAIRPATDGEIIAQKASVDVGEANARIGREETARADAVSSVARRADSLEARAGSLEGQVGGISSPEIVARLGREETARADAISAVGRRLDTVEASSRGAGNLLSNTSWPTTDGWRFITSDNGQVIDSNGINFPTDDWHPAGENVLTIHQNNGSISGGAQYTAWQSSPFSVTPSDFIQGYCFVANHRCSANMLIYWLNGEGQIIGYQGSSGAVRPEAGGRDPRSWDRVGFLSVQVPDAARQAVMELRKYDTAPGQADSWGWWWRPYVGYARQNQTEWNPYSAGSDRETTNVTRAKISEEATASSNRDSALGTRIDRVESQATTDRADYQSKIRDEATARSSAIDTVASRTRTLESQANSAPASTINANPMFNAWPDFQELPTGWNWWVSNGTFGRSPTESNAPGTNALRATANGQGNHGLAHNNMYLSAGWYVLEAEVYLNSGSYRGSGVTLGGVHSIYFASDPDTNGVIDANGPARRKFSKLVQGGPYNGIALHPMANWDGFGQPMDAKEIIFNRVAIRPASDGEIKAQKADATLNTPGTGIVSRMTAEETARADLASATAQRQSAIETRLTRNEGFAAGDLIRKGTFFDGQPGDWPVGAYGSRVVRPAEFGQTLPTAGEYVFLFRGVRDNFEGDGWIKGAWGGKKVRVTGVASTEYSGAHAYIGINTRTAAGAANWIGIHVGGPREPGYKPFDGTITIDADVVEIRPWVQNAGNNGDDMEVRVQSMSIREATFASEALTKIGDEATARADGDGALGRRLQTIEADYVTSGHASNIAQGKVNDEATVRAREDGALAGRIQKIETSARGAGNLLSNTDFATLDGWKATNMPAGATFGVNHAGDNWHPTGENVLSFFQGGIGGVYCEAQSDRFAVTAGEVLQAYVFAASHRSDHWCSVFYWDANGNWAGYAGDFAGAVHDNGGRDISGYEQIGAKSFRVPPNATQAAFVVRKNDTFAGQDNSYGWFARPYVGYARDGQTEWNPFSHGSAKTQISAANTRITDEATASSNRDSALGGRIQTIEADYVTNGTANNIAQAKVNDEASARSREDSALSGRISTTEARFQATPVTFTARSYGNGQSTSPFGHAAGLWNGSGAQMYGNGRSYGVWVFNEFNNVMSAQTFDVYGNGEAAEGRGWVAMRDFLNGIQNGRTVIITTGDEPRNNRDRDGLREAMERCGAGDLFYNPSDPNAFRSHAAYILVGRAGIGRGNGQEFYRGAVDVDPGAWLEVDFQIIQGRVAPGAAGMQAVLTQARIAREETARADAVSGVARRADSLEARAGTLEGQVGGHRSADIVGRLEREETARADGISSVAQRLETVEASARATGTTGVVKNPRFALWAPGATTPSDWTLWVWSGNPRIGRLTDTRGGSPYCVQLLNDTANVDWGMVQTVNINRGKWVIEVTARIDSNVLNGAGITVGGRWSVDFVNDPDTAGQTGNIGGTRSWSKMMDMDEGEFGFHIMGGWSGFGGVAPKYFTVFAANLRPATAGEILANKVNNDLGDTNARLGREETARADAISAITRRAETLESNYSGVRTDLNNWNNDRYNQANEVNARVGREETARADAISAVSNRTSIVEAQISNDSNNLLRNGTFNAPGWGPGSGGPPPAWRNWSQDNGAYIGAADRTSPYGARAVLQIDRNGINNGIAQDVPGPLAPGWYAFEVDVAGEDGNWSGAGVHCNFNNGSSFNFGFATNNDTAERFGDIGNAARRFTWLFYNAQQSNGATLYLMAGWSGFQGDTNFGFVRTLWHRMVMRPATAGEIQARKVQDSNLMSRVSQTESAVANINGKVAAYWQVQAVAGNNRAQMTVHADANGGAGVDIVGDVRFSGGNANGTCIVNGNGLNLYYANGQQAVRLSI